MLASDSPAPARSAAADAAGAGNRSWRRRAARARSDPAQDVAAFKSSGGAILVGTPGRLDDVMQRLGAAMDTRKVEVLVSDTRARA